MIKHTLLGHPLRRSCIVTLPFRNSHSYCCRVLCLDDLFSDAHTEHSTATATTSTQSQSPSWVREWGLVSEMSEVVLLTQSEGLCVVCLCECVSVSELNDSQGDGV